jgi:hypothetical protein
MTSEEEASNLIKNASFWKWTAFETVFKFHFWDPLDDQWGGIFPMDGFLYTSPLGAMKLYVLDKTINAFTLYFLWFRASGFYLRSIRLTDLQKQHPQWSAGRDVSQSQSARSPATPMRKEQEK